MNSPPKRVLRQARACIENQRASEGVGQEARPTQAEEEADDISRGAASGEALEAGIPYEYLGSVDETGEDGAGVVEVGGEGADEGGTGEGKGGEGSTGFDDVGVDLLELGWGVEV